MIFSAARLHITTDSELELSIYVSVFVAFELERGIQLLALKLSIRGYNVI